MHKIACRVEYQGHAYSGWQFQKHSNSVQACVEDAISRVANETVTVICAGRTDAGVHATGQVIHFETNTQRSDYSWIMGINANLPDDIAIKSIHKVNDDFHARFSATSRSYRYIIYNKQTPNALYTNLVTLYRQHLDADAMQEAAKHLVGKHDFSSYRAARCQANTAIRTISELNIERKGDYIYIDITANAFLYHMVRNIVGVLLSIGVGEQPIVWAKSVLEAKDRKKGGVTALSDGLYLVRVQYPPEHGLSDDFAVPQYN